MRWDDMSMSQKSEAIGLMVRNGVTDIGTMKQMWDDMDGRKKLKPSYADWVKGVNPHFMGPDYNLKAAYDELPFETMEAWRKDPNANHLPDTYKLPNHPTFSNESKYSQGPVMGGSWHYKPISQGKYMPEEILVGGINGVDPKPSYRSFAEGGGPDDPPYWGQPTSQPQGPIDYLNRYIRSKAFERRSPNADYLNTARQNVDSFDRVYNDPAPKRIKYSPFYSNHMIQMYPGGRETPYAPYNDTIQVPYMAVLAHEYGHNIDPYFESTRDIPENWMDMYERQSSEANEHDSRPQEIYADLQSLRYQLYEKNIYDIIKDGAFNEKHLEKALKQNIPNRLLQTMPKETIIEMMNTIADNSQQTGNVQDAYILPTDVGLGYV